MCTARNQRGFSLIELLVAIAIMGLVSKGMLTVFTYGFRSTKHIELKNDLERVRITIQDQIDCKATMTGQTCPSPPGTYFPMMAKTGGVLAPVNGAVGDWNVRASCTADRLVVEKARLVGGMYASAGAPFARNPMTGFNEEWSPLYSQGVVVCRTENAPGLPPCPPGSPFCPSYLGQHVMVTANLVRNPSLPGCDAQIGDLPSGTSKHQITGWLSAVRWTATINCPAGPEEYRAVSGGAVCDVPAVGGVQLLSQPFNQNRQWFVSCCVADTNGMPAAVPAKNATIPSPYVNAAFAICAPTN